MIEQLRQLRKFVVECREELCGAIQLDLSRSPHESELAEIIPILGEIDLAIKRVSKWSKIEKCAVNWVNLPGKAWIRTRSIGNVLIIGAFNYPVILVIGPLIHAIAAGNRAVLKVSELCPNVGKVIAENIGRYVDDVEVVQGGADVTQRILNQRKFDLVFFTGSERVGKIIACIAAKSLTPVVLELGGKCPAVVDKSADLKVSAKRIAWSKWLNCGQTCTAVDYAIVHQDVYQRFVEELKSAFEEFSVYQDPKFSKDYARIISSLHVDRIRDLVEKSNVKIEYGGQFDSEQRYVSPTILGNVSRNSLIMQEEIFGPVLPLLTFSDASEAIEIMNDHPTPLAAYIFSKNQTFKSAFEAIQSGAIVYNDCMVHFINPSLPFGGINSSGMGKYHGKFGFDTFSHKQAILHRSFSLDWPYRYPPYSSRNTRIVNFINQRTLQKPFCGAKMAHLLWTRVRKFALRSNRSSRLFSESSANQANTSTSEKLKSVAVPAVLLSSAGLAYYYSEDIFSKTLQGAFSVTMNSGVPEPLQMLVSGFSTAFVNVSKAMGKDRVVQIAGVVGGIESINYVLEHAQDPQYVVMALALAISLASDPESAARMIDNDEFLDKLFHACVTENVDIARTGGSVLLFLIKSADSMGIEKLLKSNLMQYLEKMFTYRDPEVMQSAVFSGANLLKNFPESYKSKLGIKQKDLIFNAGLHLAQIFQQQDKLQAAVDVYKDLEKIFPRQPYIKSCLGTTLREMGASDLAVQYFKEALQLDRTMLISRILLAKTLLERFGDRGKAEATKILYDGLTVHKYQEGVSEVYMMLAEILDESRKYSQACDVLKQLVTFQQKNARAKIMLGKMLLKRKDYKSALKYLQQARELQPYDSETFLYLGKVYLSLNKLDDAESALEQSVQLNPAFGHGEGYRLLGKLNLKRGKLHEALEKFREFTSRRTQDPEGYIRMAEIALELGDESLTNQNLGEALELWVSRFQKSGAIAFRKHPEDLRVLRNMSQKCVSSTLISGSLCAKISLLISDIDSQKTE